MENLWGFIEVLVLFAILLLLLEPAHRRACGLPRASMGADIEGDADLRRIVRDLEVKAGR